MASKDTLFPVAGSSGYESIAASIKYGFSSQLGYNSNIIVGHKSKDLRQEEDKEVSQKQV